MSVLTTVKEKVTAIKDKLKSALTTVKDKVKAKLQDWVIDDWQESWKYLSNWALAVIAYVSVAGVPQEVLNLLPAATQSKVIAIIAVLGFVGRFVKQQKTKAVESA